MARFYGILEGLGGGRITRTGSRKSGVEATLQDDTHNNRVRVKLYSADPTTPLKNRDCNDENMVDILVAADGAERTLFSGSLKELEEACDTGRLPRRV